MNLIHYNNPWYLLNNLQGERYNPEHNSLNDDETLAETANWTPSVDIHEDENAFILLADIPGVEPKDIEISTKKNVLTIKGERRPPANLEENKSHHVERQTGQFYRLFTLPDNVDSESIEAKSAHGVLTITIRKQELVVARKIEVKH